MATAKSAPVAKVVEPETEKVETPAEAPKRIKRTSPPLDYAALTVEDAPQPVKTGSVSATENPALAWLKSSLVRRESLPNGWRGAGKRIVVPAANATAAEGLLRKAAQTLSVTMGERIGVALQRVDVEGGKVEIRYAAKNGKQYKARK